MKKMAIHNHKQKRQENRYRNDGIEFENKMVNI